MANEGLELVVAEERIGTLEVPAKLEDLTGNVVANFLDLYDDYLRAAVCLELGRRGKTIVKENENSKPMKHDIRGILKAVKGIISINTAAYLQRKGKKRSLLNTTIGTIYGTFHFMKGFVRDVREIGDIRIGNPNEQIPNYFVETQILGPEEIGAEIPDEEALERLLMYTLLEQRIKYGNKDIEIGSHGAITPTILSDVRTRSLLFYRAKGELSKPYRATKMTIHCNKFLNPMSSESGYIDDKDFIGTNVDDGKAEIWGYVDQQDNPEFERVLVLVNSGQQEAVTGDYKDFVERLLENIVVYTHEPKRFTKGLLEMKGKIKDRFSEEMMAEADSLEHTEDVFMYPQIGR
jgi:hypothetical protein